MNTANLQLEGLYVAVSALMDALRQKGVLTEGKIEARLADAETRLSTDPQRSGELSHAHLDAILFPLRYLRLANRTSAKGAPLGFGELAARVGREKPHPGIADGDNEGRDAASAPVSSQSDHQGGGF